MTEYQTFMATFMAKLERDDIPRIKYEYDRNGSRNEYQTFMAKFERDDIAREEYEAYIAADKDIGWRMFKQ